MEMGSSAWAIRACAWWMMMTMMLCRLSQALWLTIPPPSQSKCVAEEIQSNVVVLAHYYLVSDHHPHPSVSVQVRSPFGDDLHHNKNVTQGQFAFTTHQAGSYVACFQAQATNQTTTGGELSVNLDWRIGIAAKDWDSVAKREKIQGVELELRKLESAVEAIHENLLYLKNREKMARAVSEIANTRVAIFSIMSLMVCIVVSTMQIVYLKRYFRKKKLI